LRVVNRCATGCRRPLSPRHEHLPHVEEKNTNEKTKQRKGDGKVREGALCEERWRRAARSGARKKDDLGDLGPLAEADASRYYTIPLADGPFAILDCKREGEGALVLGDGDTPRGKREERIPAASKGRGGEGRVTLLPGLPPFSASEKKAEKRRKSLAAVVGEPERDD